MSKIFDFIVVGSGIGGSSISHWLLKRNLKVGIFDHCSELNNASSAAGCWIVPSLTLPKTKYHHFISSSFNFTKEFYQSLFESNHMRKYNNFYYRRGCWNRKPSRLLSYRWEDIKNNVSYNLEMDEKSQEGDIRYFHKDSLFMNDPKSLLHILIENDSNPLEIMHDRVYSTDYDENSNIWIINGSHKTKNIILSTGSQIELVNESYIHQYTRKFYGEVIEVSSDVYLQDSYQDGTFLSPSLPYSGNIVVGSSNIEEPNEIRILKERDALLNEFMKLTNTSTYPTIQFVRSGTRMYSHDNFPIVGNLINSKSSLRKFPCVVHGDIVDNLEYIPNKFIFTAFGGKGFLTAPFLSWLFVKSIFDEPLTKEEKSYLKLSSPERLFYKWARKDSHLRSSA